MDGAQGVVFPRGFGMGLHRKVAAALSATCWALWLADAQEVSTFSKKDKYFYLTSAMTCEDAGLATIETTAECEMAAKTKAGWVGKIQLASDPVMCGCVIGRSTGKVAFTRAPRCNSEKNCADSEACFCKRASEEEAAPPSGGPAVPPSPSPSAAHGPVRQPEAQPGIEGLQIVPPGKVNCGGSFADDCSACPQGHGQSWCNGDCHWITNACVSKVAPPTEAHSSSPFDFFTNQANKAAHAVESAFGLAGAEPQEAGPAVPQGGPQPVLGSMGRTSTTPPSTTEATTARPRDPFKCPGSINVEGYGPVEMVNAKWNVPDERAETVDVRNREVVPHMSGRTYFADACRTGPYDNRDYVAMKLLGKTMKYTTDISGAGCGCNAALYMTSLHQSSNKSKCHDHYCDANSVCGEACAEIDIQEANNVAWHSTVHVFNDGGGLGGGFGGGGNGWSGPRDWASQEYQPGSDCVDTSKPFQVAVSFPVDASGKLEAMSVVLSQEGRECELSTCVRNYGYGGRDGMTELTKALREGMTPIISYWSSDILIGMDGRGPDNKGPCVKDDPGACADTVKFYDFSITDIPAGQPMCRKQCSSNFDNCQDTGCCNAVDRRCFEKDDSWASCKTECEPGLDPLEPADQRSPWTCRLLGDQKPLPSFMRHRSQHRGGGDSQGGHKARTCSQMGDNCKATGCCVDGDRQCYEKDDTFASCRTSCEPGIDENEDEAFQSPWSCKRVTQAQAGFWGNVPEDKAANPYKDSSYELMSKSSKVEGSSNFWRTPPSAASAALAASTCAALLGAAAISARRLYGGSSGSGEARRARAANSASTRNLEVASLGGDRGYLSLQAVPDSPLCSSEVA